VSLICQLFSSRCVSFCLSIQKFVSDTFIYVVFPEFILTSFMKETAHICFQRKDVAVGQSVISSQGLPHHLVNSQTVSPHLVSSQPAVSQHIVSSQPAVSHMMPHHALGGHLVTSQPVMSSGNTVPSGLQQLPCSELFVRYTHRLKTKLWDTAATWIII
jgi:hypothetical protein